MSAPRPFLIRLFVLALAIAGATGVTSRAPHALRVWADVAGEVAPEGAAPRAREHDPRRAPARVCAPAASDRRRIPFVASAPEPRTLGSLAWPTAHAGRDVLMLKRSRLI